MKQITLTRGLAALIDDEDYPRVSRFKWSAVKCNGKFYAARRPMVRGKGQTIYLHRFLLEAAPGLEGDHIDGDGLNCVRSNLRICTHAENRRNNKIQANNTSGYRGVSWCRSRSKWEAYINLNRQRHNLGRYPNAEDAARAYDHAARLLFGDFARLNFPGEN